MPSLVILTLLVASCSQSVGGSGDEDIQWTPVGDGGKTDIANPDVAAPDVAAPDVAAPDFPGCDDCALPATCIGGFCVEPVDGGCEPGKTTTCYGEDAVLTCDESGSGFVPAPCPVNQGCFGGQCMPVICVSGSSVCEGLSMKKACNDDGTGFEEPVPCPDGQYCTSGKCGSSCMIDPKFGSYVGCVFWTVDLPNYPDFTLNPTPENLPHAVVVSNPGELATEVSFDSPAGVVVDNPDPMVEGGKSRVFLMPVTNVQGTGVFDQGIRLTSTRPVLVHQFNPWDNQFSNDASLLLPEPFLGSEYVILTWPTSPLSVVPIPGFEPPEDQNGYFSVLAPHDDTAVTFQVTAAIKDGNGVSAMPAGGVQTVTLQAGEVLNVEASPSTLFEPMDLTGSTVKANKPVAVFAGHEEAVIGDGCCADHLEEQMLPPSILGSHYLAVKTKPRGSEPDYWRVQAAEDNVTVSTVPPIAGLHGTTLGKRGAWVEAAESAAFEIQATGDLQVGQYLVSQEVTEQYIGDPSLILAIPVERFRTFYVLMVPPDYSENWVTIIRPAGAAVSTSSGPIPDEDFTSFGTGAWEYAYVALTAGIHTFEGDGAFGVVAYGFNNAVSYGYPGGMTAPGE